MRMKNFAAIYAAASLVGCAAVPVTSTEFRDSVRQEGRYIDSFVANRPFGDVARTVRRMSDECLNFSLTIKENGIVKKPWAYANTTFSTSPQRAELNFQRKIPGQIGTYHEKGMYYLVADMVPAGPGKTKVDVYYWDDVAVAAKAIRGWATGDMLGCPDPLEMF